MVVAAVSIHNVQKKCEFFVRGRDWISRDYQYSAAQDNSRPVIATLPPNFANRQGSLLKRRKKKC